MICKKCGTENVDTNKYCSSCGELLIKDIVSDSGMIDKNGDVKQSTKKYKKGDVESTKEYQRGKAQTFKRRHSNPKTEYSDLGGQDQPRTGVPRRYAAPKRALNSQKDSAAYDYNDNFDNNKYEKTGKVERQQYEYAQAMRRRRNAANIPYLIVTYFTALVSLLNFALPFLEWVRFQFSVDMVGVKIDTKLSIVQTIDKLFKINNVNDMLGDSINNILSWDVVPDFLGKNYDKLNSALAFSKLAALIIFSFMAIGLILYIVFFLLAVFQRRSATGVGIASAVVMLLSCGAFVFAATYINSQTNGMISLENAAYQALVLQVVIIILVSVMSVLRALSRRR